MADSANSNSAVKTGAIAGAGGLAVGLFATLGSHSWLFLGIVIVGMLVVGALIFGYVLILRTLDKRRSAAGDQAIQDDSRRRSQKITDPEQLAKISELGRQFEEGVKKYRQATGQRLSESSWYVFTGTPGSGKTEAVRHCGIQMPEGLHKEQQGAGGTVNMDWWFTEDGIILDTAGRYLSDNTSSAEWERFLKLLTKARPDCPINGMLIALPADSLQKDTTEEVQQKATEISKFLDRSRNALGVRFPVFVVITKSDLIPGFREFFAHVNDPELQHQIVGWSKPGSLDETFEPDDVEEYLKTLRSTLLKRRTNLLSDPVNAEDPDGRRLNEVDSLYLFPDGIMEIAPRLKRYLQMVFVKSKFNQTPLFLRGIYFTSAFEEGAVLDSTLARIRGVSLEDLEAEGRTWRRERALFLRELFEKKVFKENGLVTRASNIQAVQRQRNLTLLGAGFAALIALGCFTYYSYIKLAGNIGPETAFWTKADSEDSFNRFRLFDDRSKWTGDQTLKFGDTAEVSPAVFFTQMKPPVGGSATFKQEIAVPALFRPLMPRTYPDFNELRRSTFRILFDKCVLIPLVRQTCEKLKLEAPATTKPASYWDSTSPATLALVELLKLESLDSPSIPIAAAVRDFTLKPLFRFLNGNDKLDKVSDELQATMNSIYDRSGKPILGQSTDPATLETRCRAAIPEQPEIVGSSIAICIEQWQQQWFKQPDNAEDTLSAMEGVRTNIKQLAALDYIPPKSVQQYNRIYPDVLASLEKVSSSRLPDLSKIPTTQPEHFIGGLLRDNNKYQKQLASQTWDLLLSAIPQTHSASLDNAFNELSTAATTPPAKLKDAFNALLARADAVDSSVNKQLADGVLQHDSSSTELMPLDQSKALCKLAESAMPDLKLETAADADTVAQWRDNSYKFDQQLGIFEKSLTAGPSLDREVSGKLKSISVDIIQPALAHLQIRRALDGIAKNAAGLKAAISAKQYQQPNPPALFLVKTDPYRPEFAPEGASELLKALVSIHLQLGAAPLDGPLLQKSLNDKEGVIKQYLDEYLKYWSSTVEKDYLQARADSWDQFRKQLTSENPGAGSMNDEIRQFRQTQLQALQLGASAAGAKLSKPIDEQINQPIKAAYYITASSELSLVDAAANTNAKHEFEPNCENTWNAWKKLATCSGDDARAIICDPAKIDQFQPNYISSVTGKNGALYWTNLYQLALSLLADDFERSSESGLKQFNDNYSHKYPLTSKQNGADNLSVDDAHAALDILKALLRQYPAASSKTKSFGLDPKMEEVFQRLYRSDKVAPYAEELQRQMHLLALITESNCKCTMTFFSRKNESLKDQILPVNLERVEHTSEPDTIQTLSAECDSSKSGFAVYRLNGVNKEAAKDAQLAFPMSGEDDRLWLTGSTTASPQRAKKQQSNPLAEAPWVGLSLIQNFESFPSAKGNAWFVLLPPSDKLQNDEKLVLVRLEFTTNGDARIPDAKWW